jgi:hypothetical protein
MLKRGYELQSGPTATIEETGQSRNTTAVAVMSLGQSQLGVFTGFQVGMVVIWRHHHGL